MFKISSIFSLLVVFAISAFGQGFNISPPDLDFGPVVVGTSSTLQATVSNTDTSDLIISNIISSAGQFTFSPGVFPITILSGGSQVVDVTFTPAATGLLTGNLTITHNAAGSPTVYSIQGTGAAPGFTITPPSIDFGSVVLGTSSTIQSTISNTGTSDLVITGIISSAGQFTFSPGVFPITILSGGSQVVDVTFTPAATGLLTGNLTITHNAAGSPTVYSIQGTGAAPGFTITPPSIDFGSVVLGTSSTIQSTISNTGTSDLVITGIISSAGQFTFSPGVFPITILSGGSQVVDVTFTPAATGLLTGNLTITHNAAGSPTVYSIQGTGAAPGFTITPPSIDFGSVVLGTSSTIQSTISNTGTSDLVITGIISSAGQFTFSPGVFPITILSGGSQVVDVTFTPAATGLLTGNLTITHNAAGSPTVYSIQGTGAAPGFTITPPSIDFGSVVLGTSSTIQSTISNTGTSDLVITGIISSAGQFTFSPGVFPITILSGGSQVVDVTFTPAATGLLTGNLTITHNAAGSPTVYSIQGTGAAPGFTITPPSIDFGSVVLGTSSTIQSTISNTGTSDLVITGIISSAGQFTFSPGVFPITILSGGSQVVDVTFTPAATGLLTGNLTITHNAAGSPTVYSIQGTGAAPGFTITPPSIDFGSVVLGTSSTIQSTISNTGTSDLVITGIISSAGQFTFSPGVFPITILSGGSQVVDVTFTPAATGLLTGNLTITHNAAGSPTVYSIQGTGAAPGFTITPPSIDFGSVVLGTSSTIQSTISNTGTSDLVITGIISSAGQFTFSPGVFPITILSGGSQVVDVTFTPAATGLLTGNLTITHNAAGSPTVYSIQGTGAAPGFTITPPSIDFGSVVLGTSSTIQSTISNTGTSDLVITGIISSAGQFTFSPGVFPITILSGGSQVVDVTFTPAATGLLTGNLTITHNAAGSPTVYSIQGTGAAPGFTITPPSIDFGSVVLGTSSTIQSTISNTGTSDLVITGIISSAGQFTFSPGVFPITILSGGSQVVDVTFTPAATGLLTGNLTITHNAAGSPTVYSIQGTGAAPGFTITPPSIDFGSVVLGTSSTIQSTISNTGTSDLVITGIISSAGQFTFSPGVFPITILSGGSQVVDVTFTPAATGLLTGNLTITHNAAGSPTVYSIQGTGAAPGFTITPPSIDFGSVVLGTSSTIQSTISNTGTSDLVITGIISSAGQFTFSPGVFPITILSGGSQVVDVTFTPAATGLLTGNLTITHNAAGSPTVYSIQGRGVGALSSSINLLNLVNVITSSVVDTQITVTNNHNIPLLVSANIINTPYWSITPDTALIPASGSLIFTLSFSAPSIPDVIADNLIFSTPGFSSLSIPLAANVVSEAGIIFDQDSVYRFEDNQYVEVMQLKSLTDSLHALQFRIQINKEVTDDVILIFQNIQKGTDVSDANWILNYTVTKGLINPNGASADEVFVLLYNINQAASLAPGDYNDLFRVNYAVANLAPLQDSLRSTFKVTNAEASTYQGLPIDISPSREILTVIARNHVSWLGDVNIDGFLDILDVIMVIDHIVNVDSLNSTEFFRADIAPWLPGTPAPEPDGIVNIQELSLIQNIILTGYYPDGTPIGSSSIDKISDSNNEEQAKVTFYINKDGIKAKIDTKIRIRGAQVEYGNVNNDPGNMVIDTDLGQGFYFYVTANQLLRTLLYDPVGEKYIEPGEHFLAETPFLLEEPEKVTIEKIILVDIHREKLLSIKVDIIYGEPTPLPQEYMLYQNYPNPFNPSTVINFSVPKENTLVTIKVYNSLGEEIGTLINQVVSAGNHQVNFDALGLSSGVYFYTLSTGNFVDSKKMILMK